MATTKKTTTKNSSRSGNPAKKAAAAQVASVSAFKKRREGVMLTLPSDLVVKARRIDLQTLILHGSVPNALMEIVSEALEKGSKVDPATLMGVEGDEDLNLDMVRDMYELADKVVVESIVEPRVHPLPEDGVFEDDLLYVNDVEDEDKMFIFQWATGGTSDVATFRAEAAASLVAVAEGKGAGASTE